MDKHLLVVDDDPRLREMVNFILSNFGYKVSEAINGSDALSLLLKDDSFDLIVTDIQMPAMSEIELIEEIYRRDMTIPVCVVSGLIDNASISKLQGLGISDYLAKPYLYKELLQKIDDMFSIAEMI